MVKATTLIMAAGSGERFQGGEPKQFCLLKGRPALLWSAEMFSKHAAIEGIVAVVPEGYERKAGDLLGGVGKITDIITGGKTRQESVLKGLEGAKSIGENVLVHDAVRPCLSTALVDRVLSALEESEAVVPVIPVVDTLYRESGGEVDAVLDRVHIARVQTPQGFRTDLLLRAHRDAARRGFISSDEGSLVFSLSRKVKTIAGEQTNIKITYREDIRLAEALLPPAE